MQTIELNDARIAEIKSRLQKRSNVSYDDIEVQVKSILDDVQKNGDAALIAYTNRFDGVSLDESSIEVTKEEIAQSYKAVLPKLLSVMQKAHENILAFHEKQKETSWFMTNPGIMLGQRVIPMERCGVYVPGGKALYPSTVMMNVVPAKVAGVEEIIMTTPPDKNGQIAPHILAAAGIAGVDRIFKCGGAQAIAALAYGTKRIPKVDKIVGPGNIYVALAKRLVFGKVSIDSIAGPSEVLVWADESANPRYVAADMLSQAEHDEMASAILVTTSKELAASVEKEIALQVELSERKDILQKSLDAYGYILIADSKEQAAFMVNEIASEHLEIQTKDPLFDMTLVKHAGAIFLGEYACEPLGDYFAGPNHVLPTNGTARFFSALSVDDFTKKSSVISYTKEALLEVADDIATFAESEHLDAHARSIRVRMENE